MWVKICGMTNLDDATHAVEAGADALGFVFAPSPRQVTIAQVQGIVQALPGTAETCGVFVDASAEEIVRTVLECGLTGVQLHSDADARLASTVRRQLLLHQAETTRIVSVLRFDEILKQQVEAATEHADAVLVDTRSATRAGGTGNRWDWEAGSATFREAAGRVRMIAAGGLDPDNVAEAIETLMPWGVDVVTGVESSPGRKDHGRVAAFIEAAKAGVALRVPDVDALQEIQVGGELA